ncbi:transcriptional regulator, TetR family [Nannocystis exedens]|uniref:Transcriptional regulator, TetR family n=1 Tax=Nannocystis exedens TaxID=54 RepID=A0A1I1UUS2_9BACT|nr:TetR/AcrR family transcriptional regulator [Nannocystis exedens]PCC72097.1 TetR family transcriptional regulator [Nannocystis exedens]SFD74325.1 transcriptional regulator, TetR family [Nannocystis exedens]
MAKPEARPYHSPARRRQADATRQQILAAARTLLAAHGYEGTTIDAIARAAGVAAPTVYAAFGSKRGIVAELINQGRFGPAYETAVTAALSTAEPAQRLAFAAKIARTVYEGERAEMELLRGVGVVAPELAALEREGELDRREAQRVVVEALAEAGQLREDLDVEAARDVLWAMTGRELFRLLVLERGWSADRWQEWLAEMLASALLRDDAAGRKPTKKKRG